MELQNLVSIVQVIAEIMVRAWQMDFIVGNNTELGNQVALMLLLTWPEEESSYVIWQQKFLCTIW